MGLFSKGGFFDKVTRGFDKVTGGVAGKIINSNTIGKLSTPLLTTVGTIVAPGIGTAAGAVLGSAISGAKKLLPESAVTSIVNAVARDGEVKVDKIEETIAKVNPTLTAPELVEGTKVVTKVASTLVPSATINDNQSLTDIPFMDKIKSFFVKYKMIVLGVGGAVAAYFLFFRNQGRGRKKNRRF